MNVCCSVRHTGAHTDAHTDAHTGAHTGAHTDAHTVRLTASQTYVLYTILNEKARNTEKDETKITSVYSYPRITCW